MMEARVDVVPGTFTYAPESSKTSNNSDARESSALLVVALRHIATQGRVLIKHGHLLGVMKHAHITHAVRRRISSICS
jgi:hypothetical protein